MANGSTIPERRSRLLALSVALFAGSIVSTPLLWGAFGLSVGLSTPFVVLMLPACLLLILPWTRPLGKAIIGTLALIPSPVVIGLTGAVRGFTYLHRRAAGSILHTDIPSPYLVPPKRTLPSRFGTIVRDAATWRDLTWLLLNSTLGLLMSLLTWVLFAGALWYFILPALDRLVPADLDPVPRYVALELLGRTTNVTPVVSLGLGVMLLVLWWQLSPVLMRAYGRLARLLLGPTEGARLRLRVHQLAQSRADTVDSQAAEIRRIERDLHDGAQARLVALGMNLGMAEELLTSNPEAARELLAEARQSSGQVLAELRNLVRGIHPPVLADRGLDGAVRALALDSPLHVEVDIELPGRPTAPVESAAYFAVAETLTNAAKHSHSTSAWVRIRYENGTLVLVVGDHGKGGAAVGLDGGLQGIRRRLAAFDGRFTVTSPTGGPTVVEMEVPCDLVNALPKH